MSTTDGTPAERARRLTATSNLTPAEARLAIAIADGRVSGDTIREDTSGRELPADPAPLVAPMPEQPPRKR